MRQYRWSFTGSIRHEGRTFAPPVPEGGNGCGRRGVSRAAGRQSLCRPVRGQDPHPWDPKKGQAKVRIDGKAKVTGAKVFARDIRAQDMPHWPQQQAHAFILRTTGADIDAGRRTYIAVCADARNLIAVTLDGIRAQHFGEKESMQEMPGFAGKLSDKEVADLSDYMRATWGAAAMVSEAQVKAVRAEGGNGAGR